MERHRQKHNWIGVDIRGFELRISVAHVRSYDSQPTSSFSQVKYCPMSALPTIRPAVLTDLPALLDLENRAFSSDRMSARQYLRHVRSATAEIWVAVGGAILLGNAVVFFRGGVDIARLYSIAVLPQAQGLRIGTRLLETAERRARKRGCRRMRLEVRQDNLAAIRLYEREGYRRFGERLAYYEDGMPAWRYEKNLFPVRKA